MDRFISDDALQESRAQKEKEWSLIHGDASIPPNFEEKYDPRSLYERLQEQREIKEQTFRDRIKLSNQYRSLNRDELGFYAELDEDRKRIEHDTKLQENEAIKKFRELASVSKSKSQDKETPQKIKIKPMKVKSVSKVSTMIRKRQLNKQENDAQKKKSRVDSVIREDDKQEAKEVLSMNSDKNNAQQHKDCKYEHENESPVESSEKQDENQNVLQTEKVETKNSVTRVDELQSGDGNGIQITTSLKENSIRKD